MCKHLVETFAQVLEGSENDEKAITAMGLLNTMETILTVMEDNEELHAQLGMISHNKDCFMKNATNLNSHHFAVF